MLPPLQLLQAVTIPRNCILIYRWSFSPDSCSLSTKYSFFFRNVTSEPSSTQRLVLGVFVQIGGHVLMMRRLVILVAAMRLFYAPADVVAQYSRALGLFGLPHMLSMFGYGDG